MNNFSRLLHFYCGICKNTTDAIISLFFIFCTYPIDVTNRHITVFSSAVSISGYIMKEMSVISLSPSELSSPDLSDVHDTQASQEPLNYDLSSQKKCNIKGFFCRNAFVLLTIAAIAIGKSLQNIMRENFTCLFQQSNSKPFNVECIYNKIYFCEVFTIKEVYEICSHFQGRSGQKNDRLF